MENTCPEISEIKALASWVSWVTIHRLIVPFPKVYRSPRFSPIQGYTAPFSPGLVEYGWDGDNSDIESHARKTARRIAGVDCTGGKQI